MIPKKREKKKNGNKENKPQTKKVHLLLIFIRKFSLLIFDL